MVLEHGGRRAMQLNEVEGVDAEVAARAVDPRPEVLRRVVLGTLFVAASHLRRDDDAVPGPRGEEAADDLL